MLFSFYIKKTNKQTHTTSKCSQCVFSLPWLKLNSMKHAQNYNTYTVLVVHVHVCTGTQAKTQHCPLVLSAFVVYLYTHHPPDCQSPWPFSLTVYTLLYITAFGFAHKLAGHQRIEPHSHFLVITRATNLEVPSQKNPPYMYRK